MSSEPIRLLTTGIPGLDDILGGGIPLYAVNVIAGGPGSGKTILTQQILFHNCHNDVRGVFFTTLSEPPFKMIRYQQQFAYFDLNRLSQNIFFVDIGQALRSRSIDDILKVINRHIEELEPQFVAIDSFKAIHDLIENPQQARHFDYDLSVNLATWMCTSFLVGEYSETELSSTPIFAVADGIFSLSNPRQETRHTRYLNIHKMRGNNYSVGAHLLTISSEGITTYPRGTVSAPARATTEPPAASERVSSGVPGLDALLSGGLPRGTATLVVGNAGTGKTLIGLQWIINGALQGEPGVIVSLQESPAQLRTIAQAFGWDLNALEEQGHIVQYHQSPGQIQLDVYVAQVRQMAQKTGARRVLIDNLHVLEFVTRDGACVYDCVAALVEEFKYQGITLLLTRETTGPPAGLSQSDRSAFFADNLLLLRHVVLEGQVQQALTVLKMSGSPHSRALWNLTITAQGVAIGNPIEATPEMLSGL